VCGGSKQPGYHAVGESFAAIWSKWPIRRAVPTFDPYFAVCAEIDSPAGPLLVFGTIITYANDRGPTAMRVAGRSIENPSSLTLLIGVVFEMSSPAIYSAWLEISTKAEIVRVGTKMQNRGKCFPQRLSSRHFGASQKLICGRLVSFSLVRPLITSACLMLLQHRFVSLARGRYFARRPEDERPQWRLNRS